MKHARAYSSERQRHGYSWSAAPPKKEIQAAEIDLARRYGSGRMQEMNGVETVQEVSKNGTLQMPMCKTLAHSKYRY